MILLTGFAMAGLGGWIFGQAFPCVITSNTYCPYSGAQEAANSFGYVIPLIVIGSFLIITGAAFMAAAHISENLRPAPAESASSAGQK